MVALDPQPEDQALFGHLLERAATVQQAPLPGERAQTTGAAVPVWLGRAGASCRLLRPTSSGPRG